MTRSLPITFPSCGGPSEGGEILIADKRTGSTAATFAEYVYEMGENNGLRLAAPHDFDRRRICQCSQTTWLLD